MSFSKWLCKNRLLVIYWNHWRQTARFIYNSKCSSVKLTNNIAFNCLDMFHCWAGYYHQ